MSVEHDELRAEEDAWAKPLIARYRAGDESAFAEIWQRLDSRVYRLHRKMTGKHEEAEDLRQVTALDFSQALIYGPDPNSTEALCLGIAWNVAIDWLRYRNRKKRRPTGVQVEMSELDAPALNPSERVQLSELLDWVEAQMRTLDERSCHILERYVVEEATQEEIAAEEQLTTRRIRQILEEIKKRLRDQFNDDWS